MADPEGALGVRSNRTLIQNYFILMENFQKNQEISAPGAAFFLKKENAVRPLLNVVDNFCNYLISCHRSVSRVNFARDKLLEE